jgi:hypothetical protein
MNKLIILIAAVAGLAGSSTAHADKVFRQGRGATWDCKQDPVVNIQHGGGNYTLKGSCKAVNLNGGGNTLTIESSVALNVNGAHNKVTIDSVDTINLVGSDNNVTYKAAISGDNPSIANVGTNNVIQGGKGGGGGAAKPAPAAADAPSDAGAQDCAKEPTAVINSGDGSYRFIGPCTKIVVNGGENTVVVESVKEIAINGSENTVTIGGADKITVLGSDNKVTYKKGLSRAKPKTASIGENNSVTQAK